MKTMIPRNVVAAALMVLSSAPLIGAERQAALPSYPYAQAVSVDSSIPEGYRRSFSTSRNEVVMKFEGTHWRSLTKRAAKGSLWQQHDFCQLLTRSDLASGKIPAGFRYETTGDGRIYLLKTSDYVMLDAVLRR